MPVTYCDRAYEEVMTWTEKTTIAYAPNRKSSKSFDRYGKYMKAKTVGETLALGSYGLDLLFDFEKGLLWSTGGPKRERPPDVLKMPKEELKKLNSTDKMLGKMYAKWKMWKANFQALEESGMTREELKALNNEQDPEGGKDSIIVAIGRRKAQKEAASILEAAKAEGNRAISDEEVLRCLRLWGFKENENRGNVMPEGVTFVHSDTIGLIKMSTCERTLVTVGSKRYQEFTQLLTKWLKDRTPKEFGQEFPYTSININKNYAARLHRDGNNCGPSVIKAFGDFTGGELNYWPSDDKRLPLEELGAGQKVTVDIKDNLLLFDGNRGHSVNEFQGERFTLVFFSVRTWNKVPKEEVDEAVQCGIPVPTKSSMAFAQGLLGPSGKDGYRSWPQAREEDVTTTPPRKREAGAAAESGASEAKRPRGAASAGELETAGK
uniref:Uncharacterized protein n=1 Tax=Alexandrium monilatum TaxID=311494 RepID=A0A7S4QAD1_9DINO